MELRYPVRDLDGLRVEVYRNLHTGNWSVRSREGEFRGLVIAHTEDIVLRNVTFHVSEVTRLRVVENKRKEVHAVVRGELCVGKCSFELVEGLVNVYYDPYKVDFFVEYETGRRLDGRYEYVGFNKNKRVMIGK